MSKLVSSGYNYPPALRKYIRLLKLEKVLSLLNEFQLDLFENIEASSLNYGNL